jgi:hypothetical protein
VAHEGGLARTMPNATISDIPRLCTRRSLAYGVRPGVPSWAAVSMQAAFSVLERPTTTPHAREEQTTCGASWSEPHSQSRRVDLCGFLWVLPARPHGAPARKNTSCSGLGAVKASRDAGCRQPSYPASSTTPAGIIPDGARLEASDRPAFSVPGARPRKYMSLE